MESLVVRRDELAVEPPEIKMPKRGRLQETCLRQGKTKDDVDTKHSNRFQEIALPAIATLWR